MQPHHPRNVLIALVLSVLLAACGNDIKNDIIQLDQAIAATGVSDQSLAKVETEMASAQTPEQMTEAAARLQKQIQVYNQAINALDFKSDEVRAIRDELSSSSHDVADALGSFTALNIRSNAGFTPERAQEVQVSIERADKKIEDANRKLTASLKKLQALGADNGVDVQL